MALEKKIESKKPENLVIPKTEREIQASPDLVIEKKLNSSENIPSTDKNQEKSNSQIYLSPNSNLNYQQERAQKIDKILEDDLNEIFLTLPTKQRQEFKRKGEETVNKINQLLNKTKIHLNRIISLIRDWLKMIPGVNKFFLEQEAKIKASKIIKLKDKV